MKKLVVLFLVLTMVLSMAGCAQTNEEDVVNEGDSAVQGTTDTTDTTDEADEDVEATEETKGIGFVMVGLGNEFFEALKAEFENRFIDLGWEVDVANGEFNPTTQITAMENYIAMEKDVIVLWAVSPEPLAAVVQQAKDAGIKVIAFVQPLENYDAALIADNEKIAEGEARLAAKWVEDTFPDAAPGSVPCAVLTRDNVDSTKAQGDILRKMSEYSDKIQIVNTLDNDEETIEAGIHSAETVYTMNPEVKLFVTVNSATALGVNNYFTAMNSPVTDYSDMGIFTINGGGEILEPIIASINDEAPLRGTVMTGGVELTVNDFVTVVEGVMDGTYSDKYIAYARNLYVFGDTVDEFMETGDVVSVTDADF